LLRDRFGNYDLALMACIALALATLIVSAGLRRRY